MDGKEWGTGYLITTDVSCNLAGCRITILGILLCKVRLQVFGCEVYLSWINLLPIGEFCHSEGSCCVLCFSQLICSLSGSSLNRALQRKPAVLILFYNIKMLKHPAEVYFMKQLKVEILQFQYYTVPIIKLGV